MDPQEKSILFRHIPAVDRLLKHPELERTAARYPRALVLKAIHQTLAGIRDGIDGERGPQSPSDLSLEKVSHRVLETLDRLARPSLRPVINATGIIVHTNLGRSLLAERVIRRFRSVSTGYSNLEYDLERGVRGSRYVHVEDILKEITSAEAAMVVNNNAAAVLIALETLARGREVVVSRGQLVEIGGSFRIPDVMKKSGARLVEVGTTNKTHLRDYEEVIGPETGLLLKVHQSNFQIVGFTEDVDTRQLVALGRKYGVPIMEDLGSGCLVDFSRYGLVKEPTVQEVISEGVDLVTFSGDKLLGGPQAGIILGRKHLMEAVKKNPLNRAVRIDKLTLLALEETLNAYRDEKTAMREIPTLKMICQTYRQMASRAQRLVEMIGRRESRNFRIELSDGDSKVGGGALPLFVLSTRLLCLEPGALSAHQMEEWLRRREPPIIVRVEKDRVLLDVRTIQDRELKEVAAALQSLSDL
ncbi:MAG: L-seryl-tRNA(Sec) selenium transferase [Deltaproteobacteria bacterium]|nr:L-seryl-tRNA(Sec) selenium transferase [Deltaproteobacteria bacterium]